MNGSGISWAICKSAPHLRQITMPESHCSVFYRSDALSAAQSTASKNIQHYTSYAIFSLFCSVSLSISCRDCMSLMPLCESPDASLAQRRTFMRHGSPGILRLHFTTFLHIAHHLTGCVCNVYGCTVINA